MSNSSAQRITTVSEILYSAAQKTRVLSHLGWHSSVRERFFASGAKELPVVEYPEYNAAPVLELIAEARGMLQTSSIDRWLARQADALYNSAQMLLHTAKPEFFHYSRQLYGAPDDPLIDCNSTSLTLAQEFDKTLDSLKDFDKSFLPEKQVSSEKLAQSMEQAVEKLFAADAPTVSVVEELSANALAGSERIRIRRDAKFKDKDIAQLIHHEAGIHVATSLNGKHQQQLPILSASHAGTTRTQEGLAVFAEFITGSIDLERLRRLSARTIAIKMAADGADFIEVYQYFLDLIRVHNFLRALVANRRPDCLQLLFCGKLDLEDIPVLCELSQIGLCQRPKYLPDWASDMRFLLSYLAYSVFLLKWSVDYYLLG